jgi:uncharacterized protein
MKRRPPCGRSPSTGSKVRAAHLPRDATSAACSSAGAEQAYAAPMELPIDLDELRRVLRRHGVRFALVYGSHAQGTAGEAADVDLGVWAEGDLDLWALTGDLPDIVDLVDLQRAPDGLAGRVALTGVVVLDDDPVRRVRWQADTRKRYLDEAPRRETFRRDFVQAHG